MNTPEIMADTKLKVIARIESASNKYAVRFEDGYYTRRIKNGWDETILTRIRKANQCSRATAQMIYCSSWGALQIMGFNLYNKTGIDISVGEYMHDMRIQRNQFYRFLIENKLDHITVEDLARDVTKREKFAKTYNGSIAYAELIKSSCDYHGVK